MKKRIIFLTKDAMYRGYLPIYGNKYWKTPNIDELAKKGTVFHKHYTAATSTIMANMGMFTGDFLHNSEMSDYCLTHKKYSEDTLFDKAEKLGYKCHIIWDEGWFSSHTIEYYDCYGTNTTYHSLDGLRQGVGGHYFRETYLEQDSSKTYNVYQSIESKICEIINSDDNIFVWLHIPHVINGRVCYGSDIDAFDHIVAIVRKYFDDDGIYISADHGNMNGSKGIFYYGFDPYEPTARIPLITPRINLQSDIYDLTSNIDIYSIIFEDKIPKRDFVFCDTAFYAQPYRKIAIINERYKYIYSKYSKYEELYDLEYDPNEECNLMYDYKYDYNRVNPAPLRELYFYTHWKDVEIMRVKFQEELRKVWKNGSLKEELIPRLKYFVKKNYYSKWKKARDPRVKKQIFKV